MMKRTPRFLLAGFVVVLSLGLSGSLFRVLSWSQPDEPPVLPIANDRTGETSLWGRQPDDGLGWSLAVGDVNGDGLDDLIVNARSARVLSQGNGEVYVLPGPLESGQSLTMPGGAAMTVQGMEFSAQIGINLDSGDMNGDGFDDVVFSNMTSNSASVYPGSPLIAVSAPVTIADLPQNRMMTVRPTENVLGFCDFNGDGYQDLFVEQFSFEQGLRVYGILGSAALASTAPITLELPSQADITIQGPHLRVWWIPQPRTMACGDIDGDSTLDLAIGVPGAAIATDTVAGRVYVLRGDQMITTGAPVTLTMPDQAGALIDGVDGGLMDGDQFGANLTLADVNHDGRSDLIIGAPYAAGPGNVLDGAGEVYLWLGHALTGQRFTITEQASWTVYGEGYGKHLGLAIAAGDFDNDGGPEILLGCAHCSQSGPPDNLAGRGYLVEPLEVQGTVSITAAAALKIVPNFSAYCLGIAVAAMNADGDGADEMVIGAPCTGAPTRNLPGSVYILADPNHFKEYLPVVGG